MLASGPSTDELAIVAAEHEAETRVGTALGLAFEAGVKRALKVLSVALVVVALVVGVGAWYLKGAIEAEERLDARITLIEGALEKLGNEAVTCTQDARSSPATFTCE